jgi:hypothetical protein
MSSLAAAWAPASRCGGGWWRGGRQRCARPRPRSRSAVRSFAAAASGKPMHAEVRDRGPDRAGSLVHPGGQCSRIATRHGWTPAGPPIADAQSREKKAPTGTGPRGPRDSTPMPLGARAAVRPGRLPLAREGRHGSRRRASGSSAGSPGVPAAGARGFPSHSPAKGYSLLASPAASARPARLAHDLAASSPTWGYSAAIVPAPGQVLRGILRRTWRGRACSARVAEPGARSTGCWPWVSAAGRPGDAGRVGLSPRGRRSPGC